MAMLAPPRTVDVSDDDTVDSEEVMRYLQGRREASVLARKYAVAVGKLLAGINRFLFEDVLQCGCQTIWLCKKWKKVTLYAKAFTLCSIGSGLFLSFVVPLREFLQVRNMQKAAKETGEATLLALDATAADDTKDYSTKDYSHQTKAKKANDYPASLTVAGFLRGTRHGRKAHKAMIASALAFWGYMAAFPIIFAGKITCDGSPPAMGLQIFFGLCVADIVLQVWVLIHTENGYTMLIDNIYGFVGGVGFSLLGRFDTYGDVSFTWKLLKCEPITWFSIEGHVFNLPCQLVYVAVFALVFGVLCMQALPGLVLLCLQKRLPMAMKFNEFNLILSVMGEEAGEKEAGEEKEEDARIRMSQDIL